MVHSVLASTCPRCCPVQNALTVASSKQSCLGVLEIIVAGWRSQLSHPLFNNLERSSCHGHVVSYPFRTYATNWRSLHPLSNETGFTSIRLCLQLHQPVSEIGDGDKEKQGDLV